MPGRAHAQPEPAVARGLEFLRNQIRGAQVGETALIALAMLKSDVTIEDPALRQCVDVLRARFKSGIYAPERQGGQEVYEAAVVALALSNLEAESRRGELEGVARFIQSLQNANGSWDYRGRPHGDTSISQYAVLGLWECDNGGAPIPPQVWDRAAAWFLSVQNSATGSWNYHRDEGDRYPETLSMTSAGVGSLLICQRQLARHRRTGESANPLLKPLAPPADAPVKYEPSTSMARVDQAIKRGLAWLGSRFTTASSEVIGPSVYYGLYGVERIGALADRETLGRVNWFDAGRQFILASQRPTGAWDSMHGEVCNTAWAILFITKSTAKTIRRIEVKRLGAGTLLGGRFLPKDLENLTVAGGRVISRPMSGAVEGMLAALEDPRVESADAALTGLIARYRAEGPAVLRPHKDRFRKLATDRDPGLRRASAWLLARSGDLDVAPVLITLLEDTDESVVMTARDGLQLLSRKIEDLGPPAGRPPNSAARPRDAGRPGMRRSVPCRSRGDEAELAVPAGKAP